MNNQMKIFQEGGMMDNSGEVVNGTEVPAGSLRHEVADDIPARLSEGEFVLPADVVRFIGLEKLMKMRDAAKAGLARMQEMGQMGNAQEVVNPDQTFAGEQEGGEEDTAQFESDIDSIVRQVETEQSFSLGGMPMASGTDLSRAPRNPAIDVRFFKSDDGKSMYITFINGKPMTAIPDGFKEVTEEEARSITTKEETPAEKAAATATQTGVSDGPGVGPSDGSGNGGGNTGEDGGIGQTPSTGMVDPLGLALNVAQLGPVFGPIASFIEAQMHNPQNVPVTDAITGLNISNVGDTGMGTNAEGQTVSSTETIAAQNAQMFGVNENDPDYSVPAAPGGQGTPSGTQGVNAGLPGFDIGVSDIGSVGDPSSGDTAGMAPGVTGETFGGEGDSAAPGGDAPGGNGEGSIGVGGSIFAKGGLVNKRKSSAKKQSKKGIAAKK